MNIDRNKFRDARAAERRQTAIAIVVVTAATLAATGLPALARMLLANWGW